MENTALIVIDVQNALVLSENPKLYKKEDVISNISLILAKARSCGIKVIYIKHSGGVGSPMESGTEGFKIFSSVAPQSGEAIIVKRNGDAFFETELDDTLKSQGIKQLIVVGMQTDFCVNATLHGAFKNKYECLLINDAHSTFDRFPFKASNLIRSHNHKWDGRLAEIVSTKELLKSM